MQYTWPETVRKCKFQYFLYLYNIQIYGAHKWLCNQTRLVLIVDDEVGIFKVAINI